MRATAKGLTLFFVGMLFLAWGLGQSAQREAHHGNQQEQQGMMMKQCQTMQEQRQEMMSKMKAMDQELQSLVDKMKTAEDEEAKLQVVESLLGKLVEQRTQMREHMMEMMPQMMEHMSQHMEMTQKSGDSSMMKCPMMSGHNPPSEDSGTQNPGHRH